MDECGHYKGCTYSAQEEADDAEVAEACEGEAEDIHRKIGFLGIFAIEEPGRYLVFTFWSIGAMKGFGVLASLAGDECCLTLLSLLVLA